jgi:hypothetical protein
LEPKRSNEESRLSLNRLELFGQLREVERDREKERERERERNKSKKAGRPAQNQKSKAKDAGSLNKLKGGRATNS